MPALLLYLLKVSVCLAAVYVFYQLLLRRLTFYNWNRWYLLTYSALSFLAPFIDITPVLEKNELANSTVISWVPVFRYSQQGADTGGGITSFVSIWQIISLLIIAGIITMLVRVLLQFVSYHKMKSKAEFLFGDSMKVYQVNEDIIPFSFGKTIFINRNLHTAAELEEIIRHEFVHARQRHSIDIICSELLCLVCWFNPFAWLLKKAIRQNLEFIADHKVLENGINKKDYQYLLLKVTGNNLYSIATPFNFSSLKKRIAMMNKIRTARVHLVKFMFVLPLVAVLLLAFRSKWQNEKDSNLSETVLTISPYHNIVSENGRKQVLQFRDEKNGMYKVTYDTVPEPALPPPVPDDVKLPDNVTSINVNNEIATVILKNGSKETYNLKKPGDKKAFEKKYGSITPPAPPPPVLELAPPVPDAPVKLQPPPPPPAPAKAPVNNDGIIVSDMKADFRYENKVVTVIGKNGTIEKYDLADSRQEETFKKKYGNPVISADGVRTVTGVQITRPDLAEIVVDGYKSESPVELKAVTVEGTQIPHKVSAVTVTDVKPADLEAIEVVGYPVTKVTADVVVAGQPAMVNIGGLVLPDDNQYIIVDGKEYSAKQGEPLKGKYRVEFMDRKKAVKKYGDKAKNGAVIVETLR